MSMIYISLLTTLVYCSSINQSISVLIFGYLAFFLFFSSMYNAAKNIVELKVMSNFRDYFLIIDVQK